MPNIHSTEQGSLKSLIATFNLLCSWVFFALCSWPNFEENQHSLNILPILSKPSLSINTLPMI